MCVSGSSITLSFLNRRTSKIWLREIPCVKNTVQSRQNRAKTPVLTHADQIQHVIAREQPIGIKRKRSFIYSTAHGLSNDTNYIWLTALFNSLGAITFFSRKYTRKTTTKNATTTTTKDKKDDNKRHIKH